VFTDEWESDVPHLDAKRFILSAAISGGDSRGEGRRLAGVELVVRSDHGLLPGALTDEPETLSDQR
jgi:hypothetical protein